jgi:hypothetical protein
VLKLVYLPVLNRSLIACAASLNEKTYPACCKRLGTTHLLFKISSVSVPIIAAPIVNSQVGAGKPNGTPHALRIAAINSAFLRGTGAVQFITPLNSVWTVLIGSELPDLIDNIKADIERWDSITIGLHKYGGLQFNYKGKEIGHVHSNGLLDIRFSRAVKAQLLAENRITDHHVFSNSGWISFYIRNADDGEYAKSLLRMAYLKMQKLL